MTFSILSAIDSNSSGVGSSFLIFNTTGLPAGTRISAGEKRWSLMTTAMLTGSSALAGPPAHRTVSRAASRATWPKRRGNKGPNGLLLRSRKCFIADANRDDNDNHSQKRPARAQREFRTLAYLKICDSAS